MYTRFLALKALRWGDPTKEAVVVVKVGVDFPAEPLIFLLDCNAGNFSSIAFLASSRFFLSSLALATAFWAFVTAAVMSCSCFLFLALALRTAAPIFFSSASFPLASFLAF